MPGTKRPDVQAKRPMRKNHKFAIKTNSPENAIALVKNVKMAKKIIAAIPFPLPIIITNFYYLVLISSRIFAKMCNYTKIC